MNNQQGFTIVELFFALFFVVVGIAVLAVFGIAFVTVWRTLSHCGFNLFGCFKG